MDSFEAQKVISQHRKNAIVVTHESANREWPQVSTNPDFDLPVPRCMSKASSFGLGLALALPTRKVIILDADGALLMNLGSLVTIANMAPHNLIHFVFENGVYRSTGGQPIPNSGKISFRGMAKAAGYSHVYEFDKLEDLEIDIETIMHQNGPTFVCLKVPPLNERPPFPLVSTAEQSSIYSRFKQSVQNSSG